MSILTIMMSLLYCVSVSRHRLSQPFMDRVWFLLSDKNALLSSPPTHYFGNHTTTGGSRNNSWNRYTFEDITRYYITLHTDSRSEALYVYMAPWHMMTKPFPEQSASKSTIGGRGGEKV